MAKVVNQQASKGRKSVDHDRNALLRSTPQRGSNQSTVRDYNERLVLQLIRNHGWLTKSEATVATGLSPNAVSVIFKSLDRAGLLVRGKPERGRIGQPSVPSAINPDAKRYMGLKIGRRSTELVIIDFAGGVVSRACEFHQYPVPERCIAFVDRAIPEVLGAAGINASQVAGFGVAMPWELWSWTEEIGAPKEVMEAWMTFDVEGALNRLGPWRVTVANDGTAACTAELMHGRHLDKTDFVYFFVGTFIGGGIVLNSSVFFGRQGNAGGFGPLRVPGGPPGKDRLVDCASLSVFEDRVRQAGGDPARVAADDGVWSAHPAEAADWIVTCARGLSHAVISSLAVIDFDSVIIDGAFPDDVRRAVVTAVQAELDKADLQGVGRPRVEAGKFGGVARAVGAATLPMYEDYAINQNTLMRSG